MFNDATQRMGGPEEERLQGEFAPAQRADAEPDHGPHENKTGMPDNLKAGIESLSGMSLDNVRVHYNSAQPAQLNALAYAQGADIHVAPGQEQHLPHEAWHIVQQAQGRVQPTMQMKDGVPVNADAGLEHEADVMGAKALQPKGNVHESRPSPGSLRVDVQTSISSAPPIQRRVGFEFEMGDIATQTWSLMSGWHNHAKGAVMAQMPGYKLTADEGAGQSQLEVIIDPIDETAVGAAAHLGGVVGPAIRNTVDAIAAASFMHWQRADRIPAANGSSFDRYRSGNNGAAGIQGQLQMTGGITMAKLHDHVSGAQATNYIATLNPMNNDDAVAFNTLAPYQAGPIAGHADIAVAAVGALGALPAPTRQQVAAVAALMATVAVNARINQGLQYAKMTAGPILARTDFAQIMMQLPPAAKGALTPAIMRQVVLATINAALPAGLGGPVVGADAVIPLGALQAAAPDLSGLDIDSWVGGVVPTSGLFWGYWKGTDQMTKKNFPGNAAQRNEVESMGGYGDRLDPGDRPIVEFRSLAGVFVDDLPGQLSRMIDFLNHP